MKVLTANKGASASAFRIALAAAAVFAGVWGMTGGTAHADDWRHHAWRGRAWHDHAWVRHHYYPYYGPYAYAPAYGYVAPPPVYPAPVYTAPYPVYPVPSVSLGFNFR